MNLSPDNLDQLFRENSDRAEFPFREDAWDDLDRRLDAQQSNRRRGGYLIGGFLALLLLLGTAGYLLTGNTATLRTNGDSTTRPNVSTRSSTPPAIAEDRQPVTVQTPSADAGIDPTGSESTVDETIDRSESNARSENPKPAPGASRGNESSPIVPTVAPEANSPQTKTNKRPVPSGLQPSFEPVVPVVAPPIAESSSSGSPMNAVIGAERIALATRELLAERPLQKLSAGVCPVWHSEQYQQSVLDKYPVVAQQSRFTVSLLAASEVNGVGFVALDPEIGVRGGVRAEYLFGGRFGIGTGLILSRRTYRAEGCQYTAPEDFWTDRVAPEKVDARLTIFELPLDFRYYARGYEQDGFYYGLGLSSYHIQRENYDFFYDDPVAGAIMDWEERSTNTHLLAVATATVGYQRTLPTGAALRIAPYYHLPLSGMGQGGMLMHSAGIQVEARLW